MISKVDLIKRALQKLAVLGPNETLSPADQKTAVDAFDAIYDELSEDGHVAWPNTGDTVKEIPLKFVRPLVDMLAFDLAPYFGKSIDRRAALADAGRRKIVALTANDYVPQATPTEFM